MDNQTVPTPEMSPQLTPTPPAANPPNKSYLPLILAVIIIFFISIFGGVILGKYLYGPQTAIVQQTLAPRPTMIPTAIPTVSTEATQSANWKTYNSNTFDYEFNYPQDWIFSEQEKKDPMILDDICIGKNPNKCLLEISVLDGKSWDKEKQLLGLTLSSKEGTKEVSFAGINGYKRIGFFGETGSLSGFVIIVQKGSNVYKIWAHQRTEDKNDYTSQIDQILSTFRFD